MDGLARADRAAERVDGPFSQASFDMLNTWPGQKGYCTVYEEGDFCAADKECDHELGYQCEKAEMMYVHTEANPLLTRPDST